MRRTLQSFILLSGLLGCLLLGCEAEENGPSPQAPRSDGSDGAGPRNVLLITLDTTRADCVGCYGNTEISTPNLDALAGEGIRIENAYATCPITFPSHASMLTGRYPFSHGVRNNTHYTLAFDNLLLSEVLRDAGWRTAAFIGSTILAGRLGLNQGFDHYFDDMFSGVEHIRLTTPWASRKAANVNYDFLNWLDTLESENENDSPGWLAWVHYYDPHYRYDPPELFFTRYAHDLYLGEIAYMDEELGRILDRLRSRGMYDDTLIIAIGDHGEGLGEHHELFHALWTYNSTLRVPFIISAPENRGTPRSIEEPTSVLDVFPTVLAWCGVECPPTPGVDLLAVDAEPRLRDRPVYFESMEARISYNWAGLRGIVDRKEKYIHTPIPEYYDLDSDPDELGNLLEQNQDRGRELKTAMYRLVDEWRSEVESAHRELSPEDIARLESLGYLTGGAVPASSEELEAIEGLADLKTKAAIVGNVGRLREEGDAAFEAGDYETAETKYRELLHYAEVFTAVQNLGEIAAYEGDEEESIQLLRRACELAPTLPLSWHNLAVAYRNFNRREEAQRAFEQAIRISPSDPVNTGSYVALAVYLSEDGDWQGALEHITTAREIDPDERELIGHEASARYQLGRIAEEDARILADALVDESKADDDPRVHRYEALLSESRNHMRRGYELYRAFLAAGEGSASHYFEAGQCAIRQEDYERALEWTRKTRDLLPPDDEYNRAGLQQVIQELEQRVAGSG